MGKIQCALSHWNCPGRQTNGGQSGGSSEPSPQSSCPSHFHQNGRHFKVFSHRKLEAEQLDLQLKPSLCKMKFSGHWQTFSTLPSFLAGTKRQRASQPPLFSQGLWTGWGCRKGWKTCSEKKSQKNSEEFLVCCCCKLFGAWLTCRKFFSLLLFVHTRKWSILEKASFFYKEWKMRRSFLNARRPRNFCSKKIQPARLLFFCID